MGNDATALDEDCDREIQNRATSQDLPPISPLYESFASSVVPSLPAFATTSPPSPPQQDSGDTTRENGAEENGERGEHRHDEMKTNNEADGGGKPHDLGSHVDSMAVYDGDFFLGRRHGFGRMESKVGKYEGEWRDGMVSSDAM